MEPGPYMPALTPQESTSHALLTAQVQELQAQLATATERNAKQQSWLKKKDGQLQSTQSHAFRLQASMDADSKKYAKLLKKTAAKANDLNRQLKRADEHVDKLRERFKHREAKLQAKRKQFKNLQDEHNEAVSVLTMDQAHSVVVKHAQQQLSTSQQQLSTSQQQVCDLKESDKVLRRRLATATTHAVETGANSKRQAAACRAVQVQVDEERKKNATFKHASEAARRTWVQERSGLLHRASQLKASQQVQPDVHALQQQLAEASQQLQAARAANTQLTTEVESAQNMAVGLLRDNQLADAQATSTAAVLWDQAQRIESLKIAQACSVAQVAAQEQQQAAMQTLLQQRLSQTQASLQNLQAQQATELGHAQQSLAEARQQLRLSQDLQLVQSSDYDATWQELAHAKQQLSTAQNERDCECKALQQELTKTKEALKTAQHAAQAKLSASAAAHTAWNNQAAQYKAQLAELQNSVDTYKALHLAADQAHTLPSVDHISQLQTRLSSHISELQLAPSGQDAADHTTLPLQLTRAMSADLKACKAALVQLKAAEIRRTIDSNKAIARVTDKNAELQETVSAYADHSLTLQAQLDSLRNKLGETKLQVTAVTGKLEANAASAAAAPSMTGPAEGEEATGSQPAPPAPTYRTRASSHRDKGQLHSVCSPDVSLDVSLMFLVLAPLLLQLGLLPPLPASLHLLLTAQSLSQ